ncbi:MAG: T9SS type A sorting domain-containing protein [Bacteroidia bacterium]|nr:T9SS type A sorting domain-containing protein [Bacteroidia bacterium]
MIQIPESTINYSESPTDSIRFLIGQGTNTQGMYIDNLVIYGIANNEINPVQNISIDAGSISKVLANHPSGANSCWLMDSDVNWPRTVSNESRFAELKLGALRFPYGHLADNYLWHLPGQYSTVDRTGPIPQVASPEIPANWTWAVNQTNGKFLKDLGFNEYVGICKRNGIEPLIVINAQSYKYTGGPTYETLKLSAAEWVRYANITKGYGIKNWQIGNEVEHDGNLTMSVYTNLFIDFATAMKAIDPTIKVGTGILSNTTWNKDVLTKACALCSFISTHNYQFGSKVAAGGFRNWYKDNGILATNTEASQKMLDANFANRPNIEIHVTETNVTGGEFPDISNLDIYKALYWFEMDMNQLAEKNVKYTYFWGTHSPWGGETNLGDIGTLLENSSENSIRPAGRVIQLINTYLKGKLISTTRTKGNLRVYASISNDGNELSVFILNKNLYAEKANLNLSNFNTAGAQGQQITFKGTNFSDVAPVLSTEQLTSLPSQIDLAPVSLTILDFIKSGNSVVPTPENELINIYFDGENIHTQLTEAGDAKLNIYTIDGRLISSKNLKEKSELFNFSYLPKGLYIANVHAGSSIKTIKTIK